MAAAAKTEQSESRDPRYRPSPRRMIEALTITAAEMTDASLRLLAHPEIKRQRRVRRRADARRAAGQLMRHDYLSNAQNRAMRAQKLRSQGASWPEVALRMGLPSGDAARKLAGRARRTGPGRNMVGVATVDPGRWSLGISGTKNPGDHTSAVETVPVQRGNMAPSLPQTTLPPDDIQFPVRELPSNCASSGLRRPLKLIRLPENCRIMSESWIHVPTIRCIQPTSGRSTCAD